MKLDSRAAIWILGCSLLTFGCGPAKVPVEEVSLSTSGIEITDGPNVGADDWNAWRGPTFDGVSPSSQIPTQWDEVANVRWRSELPGRGHGSPIVVGDRILLAAAEVDSQRQSILCFNRGDGTPAWATVVHEGGLPGRGEVHQKSSHANGTIACDGERIYTAMFNSGAIWVSCLDLFGNTLWQQEIGKFAPRHGYAPSPVLHRSLVIFAADSGSGGFLAALDGETGKIAWRVARGNGDSYASPFLANVGGLDQLVISGNDQVVSYDPETGAVRWRTDCLAATTCGTAVSDGENFYVAGGYPDTGVVCLSADGTLRWSNSTKVYEPSMIVSGDKLVAVNDGGIASCWSTDSGELQWKKRLPGGFSASPVRCGETIIVPNLAGDTYVFRAGDKYIPVAKNRLGDDAYASPAVSAGELFLRVGVGRGADRTEQLVCIGETTETSLDAAAPQSL